MVPRAAHMAAMTESPALPDQVSATGRPGSGSAMPAYSHQSRILVFHSIAASSIDTTEVEIQNRMAVSKL